MATKLTITVHFTDDSDYEWCRARMVDGVREVADTAEDEGRLDGEVQVDWEQD